MQYLFEFRYIDSLKIRRGHVVCAALHFTDFNPEINILEKHNGIFFNPPTNLNIFTEICILGKMHRAATKKI